MLQRCCASFLYLSLVTGFNKPLDVSTHFYDKLMQWIKLIEKKKKQRLRNWCIGNCKKWSNAVTWSGVPFKCRVVNSSWKELPITSSTQKAMHTLKTTFSVRRVFVRLSILSNCKQAAISLCWMLLISQSLFLIMNTITRSFRFFRLLHRNHANFDEISNHYPRSPQKT